MLELLLSKICRRCLHRLLRGTAILRGCENIVAMTTTTVSRFSVLTRSLSGKKVSTNDEGEATSSFTKLHVKEEPPESSDDLASYFAAASSSPSYPVAACSYSGLQLAAFQQKQVETDAGEEQAECSDQDPTKLTSEPLDLTIQAQQSGKDE